MLVVGTVVISMTQKRFYFRIWLSYSVLMSSTPSQRVSALPEEIRPNSATDTLRAHGSTKALRPRFLILDNNFSFYSTNPSNFPQEPNMCCCWGLPSHRDIKQTILYLGVQDSLVLLAVARQESLWRHVSVGKTILQQL